MNLFTELKRRHVFRIGIAYLVVAWLLTQVVGVIGPMFGLPSWFPRGVVILLAVGFPVALIVAWAFELTPEGVKRTDELDEAAPKRAVSTGRKLDFVIIGALIMALGYFAWGRYGGSTSTTAEPTLAVLPFEDFSPNKDQAAFADGISDELLNALARIKGLQVTGRTSSFSFKGKNEDLRTIGETLGVENILEGSVRRDGDRLRVIAQLINAKTGYHLWSHTYEKDKGDIFDIQDDIAKSVANALQITLGVGALSRLPGMTRNADAYDEYLLSQPYDGTSAESFRIAIGHATRAVEIDPNFAMAWNWLSGLYSTAGTLVPGQIPDASEKAVQTLDRASALTPDSPYILASLAIHAALEGRWLDADDQYERMRKADAGQSIPEVEVRFARFFLAPTGRSREALGISERARIADPLGPYVVAELELLYMISGDVPSALAAADRAVTLVGRDQQSTVRGWAVFGALESGDKAEIRKRLKQLSEAPSGDEFANAIPDRMGQLLDDPASARTELHKLAADPRSRSPQADTWINVWAAYYGDPELALESFREKSKTLQNGPGTLLFSPLFRDVRKLPAFKDQLRDMGLVDYWRKSGHWADICRPVGDNDFECE